MVHEDEVSASSWTTLTGTAKVVFDSVGEGVLLYGPDGRLMDCNGSALEVLGIPKDQLLGTRIAALFPVVNEEGQVLDQAADPVSAALAEPGVEVERVIGLDLPEQGRRWFALGIRGLTDDAGATLGVVITCTEVTAERRAAAIVELYRHLQTKIHEVETEDELLQHLCDSLVEAAGYKLAWIGTASTHDDGLLEVLNRAGDVSYLDEVQISYRDALPIGQGPTGTALRTGVAQVYDDLPHNPNFSVWREAVTRHGFRSSISIPFGLGWRWAVLVICSDQAHGFDDQQANLLTEVAAEFGQALYRLRRVRRHEATGAAAFGLLGTLIERGDPARAGHHAAVAVLATTIAERLEVDPDSIRLIGQAAQVHELDDPTLLARAGFSWPIPEVAASYAEHLDGSGSPNRLTADQLDLPTRVIGVACAYDDAQRSHGGSTAAALQVVEAHAGTWWDPVVLKACREVTTG